jgi:hypothetical protein
MDGTDKKICWFQNQNHVEKYIERNKLKSKDYKLESNNIEIKPIKKKLTKSK